ncbi:MAG: hypothetical protein ACR2M0_07140 [Chloroflexia bacterium]
MERDSLGEVEVPADALYGAQTVRGIRNFPITGWLPHPMLVEATVTVKKAAARYHSLQYFFHEKRVAFSQCVDRFRKLARITAATSAAVSGVSTSSVTRRSRSQEARKASSAGPVPWLR